MTSQQASIYLDHAATTPVDPRVVEAWRKCAEDVAAFANPSSNHPAGRAAARKVDQAATELASLVNGAPENIIWTSGATEANNLAITGAARFRASRGKHLVTMLTEHKAVTDVFRALAKQGFDVTWLKPRPDGLLDIHAFEQALRADTQLVSIMHINNETGVIQDIATIGQRCHEHDVTFHVDAAQSVGKIPVDVAALGADLMSITAHKMYGPKGIGALYLRDRDAVHLQPLMYGGGQQYGLRPGTLPVPLIAAFGAAAAIAEARLDDDLRHLARLRLQLWNGLKQVPGVSRNGGAELSYPGILNISVEGIEGEALRLALEPLCVASGSACNSLSGEPSAVLRSLGLSDALAESAIRFSPGRATDSRDIDRAIDIYCTAIKHLRLMSGGLRH